MDQAARFTGIGLANLVKAVDPAGFVLGGGMVSGGPSYYLDRVYHAFEAALEGYPRPVLRLAELGGDAGVIGAAAVAEHQIRVRR